MENFLDHSNVSRVPTQGSRVGVAALLLVCGACASPKPEEAPAAARSTGPFAAASFEGLEPGSHHFSLADGRIVAITVYRQPFPELDSPFRFWIRVMDSTGKSIGEQYVIRDATRPWELSPLEARELCLPATPQERRRDLIERMLR